MKNYMHLLVDDDGNFQPGNDDNYHPEHDTFLFEPPTFEVASQLRDAASRSPEEFRQVIFLEPVMQFDRQLLLYSIDEHGQNFLHKAAVQGDSRMLGTVWRSIFPDPHGRRPQHITDLREKLPRQKDIDGNRPLHLAAAHDNLDFVKALLQWHSQGWVEDPIDVDEETVDRFNHKRFPMIDPEGKAPVGREEYRYILPLLDLENNDRRNSAQEARSSGAVKTAKWLHRYRKQFVGKEDEDEEWNNWESGLQ